MPSLIDQMVSFLEQPFFRSVFWAVVFGAATILSERVATRAIKHLLHSDSNPLPTASIIVNIVRATIYIVGGSIILDACFNVDASALITALGVGGIAVSLGFQDTLSNLIGGLQVTFMGIVKPGDNIEVGTEMGVVQDVSWRHTTIRDSLGQTVIIPNSVISKTALVHLLPASRVSVPFALPRLVELAAFGAGGKEGASPDARAAAELLQPGDGAASQTRADDIDALADALIARAREAAGAVSPIVDGPKVFFSEIGELGIKGKVIFQIEDASLTASAADAVVRAIARELT